VMYRPSHLPPGVVPMAVPNVTAIMEAEQANNPFYFGTDAGLRREYHEQKACMLLTSRDLGDAPSAPDGSSCEVDSEPDSVPPLVQGKYYNLCLLDDRSKPHTARFCGYPTYVFKALCTEDIPAYALRRVDGFRLTNFDLAQSALERWSRLPPHPSVVAIRQAFATQDFFTYQRDREHSLSRRQSSNGSAQPSHIPRSLSTEGGSLVFVYDYHANAATMEACHFQGQGPVREGVLWSYIVQIVLALRHIHAAGMAARVIDPTKILVSYRNRVRLNCVGLLDALKVDPSRSVRDYQMQDLISLGRLVLALACGTLEVLADIPKTMDQIFMKMDLSMELRNLVVMLLSKPVGAYPSVHDIAGAISGRIATQMEAALHVGDCFEEELKKEVDNGRLVRLLSKIGSIVDRPSCGSDHNWAETGDRYVVKLFRDYLFHQVDEESRPVLDIGHIADSLAKVDVGVRERILLMSRDGSALLVLSYADIKRCIDKSFSELLSVCYRTPAGTPNPTHAHARPHARLPLPQLPHRSSPDTLTPELHLGGPYHTHPAHHHQQQHQQQTVHVPTHPHAAAGGPPMSLMHGFSQQLQMQLARQHQHQQYQQQQQQQSGEEQGSAAAGGGGGGAFTQLQMAAQGGAGRPPRQSKQAIVSVTMGEGGDGVPR